MHALAVTPAMPSRSRSSAPTPRCPPWPASAGQSNSAAYNAATPENAPNSATSRLSHDRRHIFSARYAYTGRPRCSVAPPSASAATASDVTRRRAQPRRLADQLQQPDDDERADRELREHRHEHERPVRCSGDTWVRSTGRRVRRQMRRHRHARRRQAAVERRAAPRPGAAIADAARQSAMLTISIGDRAFGARAHAGRRLPMLEPAVAHVALADDAALGVVLRHAVRTVPGAVPGSRCTRRRCGGRCR